MKYLFFFLIICLLSCNAQQQNSMKTPLEFEVINHYPYELTSENYLIVDTQQKMDAVFSVIHAKSGGDRLAPIPNVTADDTFIIFKPKLSDSNDVEIKQIYSENDMIYVDLQKSNNPQIEKSNRISPNILVKILKKVSPKKLIINPII